MRSACEHRPEMAKAVFDNEILSVPQNLDNSVNTIILVQSQILRKGHLDLPSNQSPGVVEGSLS